MKPAGRLILNTTRIIIPVGAALALLLAGAAPARAQTPGDDPGFLRHETAVLGAPLTGSLRSVDLAAYLAYGQIGGEGLEKRNEIGAATARPEKQDTPAGRADTGRKIKAGALSALFPGAGQFYNGRKGKAYLMGGIEVAIWTAYFVFDTQGDNRLDSSIEYAGIYAGTGGTHPDSYWQGVGRYMDSDAYYEALLREARALGEPTPSPLADSDTWQWVNEDRRTGFATLRADANSAYDRRDFMILFAVVNRAVSVVDAVLGAGQPDGTLEAEVLGLNLGVEMLPSLRNPGAQCVVSRRF